MAMAMAVSPPKLQYAVAIISLCFICCSATDVHDLLPRFNLPKGLLPRDIKSYDLSITDYSFTIELSSNPCYVKFGDHLVYYDRIIKGKLGFGKVTGVSGIQAKKFFIWVSVTAIDVDQNNDSIEFHAGAFSEKLPAKDFEALHSCKAKGLQNPFSDFMEMEAFI